MKIISWNIARRHAAWRSLIGADADVVLIQEAGIPPDDVTERLEIDPAPFRDAGGKMLSRCAVVKCSDGVKVDWLEPVPLTEARDGDFKITHPECLAAAIVTLPDQAALVVVSLCLDFEKPHRSTGSMYWNVVDASLHRIISDLSLLIGKQRGHRIVVAGDFNITFGYSSNEYWRRREATVFERMESLGLRFLGPQHPAGHRADPWPAELPPDSRNVPTYFHPTQSPETAARQLDYVFASESMADSVEVRALNRPEEWGPSDHCRIEIVIE